MSRIGYLLLSCGLVVVGITMAVLFWPVGAHAQTPVIIRDSASTNAATVDTNKGVAVSTGGRICTTPRHADTTVGSVQALNCPTSQLANRRFITLCNSNENTGSPTVKIRIDGTAPMTGLGNPGDVLATGQCVSYNIGAATVAQCIASASGTHVTSLECD